MSRARELSKLGNINVLAVDTTDTEVGIASTVPSSTLDVRGEVKIGTAVQLGVAGVVTATSFSGSGSNLTGLATTETIRTDTLTVAGVSTFTGALNATSVVSSGAVSGTTGTFSGAVNVDATTDSTSSTSGALIVDGGLGVAKNVYIGAGLSVAGTLTYEDVTNVDSVGLITAKSGVNVSGGQLAVGVAYSVGAAGVVTAKGATFNGDVEFNGNAAGVTSAYWDASADSLIFKDNSYAKFGDGSDLSIYHGGGNSSILNSTGVLTVKNTGSGKLQLMTQGAQDVEIKTNNELSIKCNNDGAVEVYYDASKKFETTNDGVNLIGITTFSSGGVDFNGILREKHNQVDAKLSADANIDLDNGMLHYYSVNETTTATPNIRYNSSKSLNNSMTIGETVTVTIIYKPNGAGYYAALNVDGSGVTEEWNGGSAPSSANAGGYDILTHTLFKVADASFLCFSNVQNYA